MIKSYYTSLSLNLSTFKEGEISCHLSTTKYCKTLSNIKDNNLANTKLHYNAGCYIARIKIFLEDHKILARVHPDQPDDCGKLSVHTFSWFRQYPLNIILIIPFILHGQHHNTKYNTSISLEETKVQNKSKKDLKKKKNQLYLCNLNMWQNPMESNQSRKQSISRNPCMSILHF